MAKKKNKQKNKQPSYFADQSYSTGNDPADSSVNPKHGILENIKSIERQKIENDSRVQDRLKELDSKIQEADDELKRIKENEQELRKEEYAQLKKLWEQERQTMLSEAEERLSEAQTQESRIESAYQARMSEAQAEIDERCEKEKQAYEEARRKAADQYKAYIKKQEDLNLDIEDLQAEKELVQKRKEKYSQCSPQAVEALNLQLTVAEAQLKAMEDQLQTQQNEINRLKAGARKAHGQDAQEQIEQLDIALAAANARLEQYADYPSISRIEYLQDCEEHLTLCRAELEETKEKLSKLSFQLTSHCLTARELENAKTEAAALHTLNDQLQKSLERITKQYETTRESKFKGLLEIDKESYKRSDRPHFSGNLKDLVHYIRNYGATRMETKLYYSEETIRVFLASLATSEPASRLIILQGLSGTGKSSLPFLFKHALDIRRHAISVQPSWRDNRELLGYDNDFTNQFKETEFTKVLYRAALPCYQDDIELIVLDEMNLARIEYYFADFLSVLEQRSTDWIVPLVPSFSDLPDNCPAALNYDNGAANLNITKNIWFVGTANNDDSTSLITDKVYDRAQILDMDERETTFSGTYVEEQTISLSALSKLFEEARDNNFNRMNSTDWDNLNKIDDELRKMDITFGNRMKTQLEDFVPVYVACGGTKEEAIDYFLAHKILRKLDEKYDHYIQGLLDDLEESLDLYYGENSFEKSKKKIDMIRKRNFNINTGDN